MCGGKNNQAQKFGVTGEKFQGGTFKTKEGGFQEFRKLGQICGRAQLFH